MKKGSKARSYLTLFLMATGAVAMGSVGAWYINLLRSIDEKGTVKFLWIELQRQNVTADQQIKLVFFFVILGALIGLLLAGPVYRKIVKTRQWIETMTVWEVLSGLVGILLGLGMSFLLFSVMQPDAWLKIVIVVVVCYVCIVALLSTKEQFAYLFSGSVKEQRAIDHRSSHAKILDTNVIIDGRISDVCKAGFLEGPILIPRFVLEELQQIADSSDPLKRARGRRGLDILNNMQKELQMQVQTVEGDDAYSGEDVDSRLVRLAQAIGGSVVTNDFNLNKVAALQGVQVLNVNELANALKPVVLPGEEMSVAIIKEGKEANQGIGYMDDGTMIVVEGGRRRIGETLDVIVTSVLQTVAGKMIFANMKAEQESEEETFDRGIRSYPGSRQRKKIR